MDRLRALNARKLQMLHSARERAARHEGQNLRARDHLLRVEEACAADGFAEDWPDYDEGLLDALEDEGLYLDEMEAPRAHPPSHHLAGFLASRVSDLLHRGAEGTTWDKVDRLAGWLERLLQRQAAAEGRAAGRPVAGEPGASQIDG